MTPYRFLSFESHTRLDKRNTWRTRTRSTTRQRENYRSKHINVCKRTFLQGHFALTIIRECLFAIRPALREPHRPNTRPFTPGSNPKLNRRSKGTLAHSQREGPTYLASLLSFREGKLLRFCDKIIELRTK